MSLHARTVSSDQRRFGLLMRRHEALLSPRAGGWKRVHGPFLARSRGVLTVVVRVHLAAASIIAAMHPRGGSCIFSLSSPPY
eukprot:scaffold278846_cov27-Prasinocladus_malaysianus.AAC.1